MSAQYTEKYLLPSIAGFILFYFGARMFLEQDSLAVWMRVTVALIPIPVFGFAILQFINGIRNADELERRIQLEALVIVFPLTVMLLFTLGMLELAIPLSKNDWSYRHIVPFVVVFYFLGLAFARRRYQ